VILDSSAIVAVIFQEPGFEAIEGAIAESDTIGIGAPTVVEAGMVLAGRLGPSGPALLQRFLDEAGVVVIPFTDHHRREALTAYLRFGRGRHAARLNLGDCHSYATSRLAGRPLLCVGDDFPQTDLETVPLVRTASTDS
jgi:ribonuclease VapC